MLQDNGAFLASRLFIQAHSRQMAINPYQPELAKRQMTLHIAEEQLEGLIDRFSRCVDQPESFKALEEDLEETLNDYRKSVKSLSEWLQRGDIDIHE